MDLVPVLRKTARETIVRFLRASVETSGRRGVVLGLSGGVDSAVCASLGVEALGPSGVKALHMPCGNGEGPAAGDAQRLARDLGIEYGLIDIGPACGSVLDLLEGMDRVAEGNVAARVRMTVLYAYANRDGLLVMGTGNKSEILTGYFTKYGDGGADILPLGDLYKTEVRALAVDLGIPEGILERPPSAGLWEGQTDEAELEVDYGTLDRVLLGIEHLMDTEDIARTLSLPAEDVERIARMVASNAHKRRMPLIPKIGYRTVGIDWRE